MLSYSKKFAQKVFNGKTTKEAYLKACKWFAINVMSKDELQNEITVKYKKDSHCPSITLELYVSLDESTLREKHCKICKEFHGLFFINENCNCSWCNTKAYQKRADEMIREKKNEFRRKLEETE